MLFICLLSLAYGLTFKDWQSKYNKQYHNSAEYLYRKAIFMKNAKFVKEHPGTELNAFADLSHEEFVKTHLGHDYEINPENEFENDTKLKERIYLDGKPKQVPSSLDYRSQMNEVKDQGNCGSCWSFCSTSVLEAVVNIKKNILKKFSEQQLIDCDSTDNGCDGGHPQNAFQFIKDNDGLTYESNYPYEEVKGTCKSVNNKYTLTGFKRVTDGDEDNLKELLNNYGPIAIGMDASPVAFQLYSKGTIFSNDNCKKLVLNHCVTLVGYGSNADGDYWIIRNSWGTAWGDNGYFLLARNKNNMCGVGRDSNYVTGVAEV